jgi:hypothetical protein
MKHLKRFNEAIVDYKSDSIKSFYDECLEAIKKDEAEKDEPKKKTTGGKKSFFGNFKKPGMIFQPQMKEIGEKCGIEVVDYETFYSELSDENKKTAPPRGVPAFALVNPDTNKPRVVLGLGHVDKRLLDHIYHMLKHENIHIGQKSRSGGKGQGEGMNPLDRKAYFSNKDEIMAFSQSISDMLMESNPKDVKSALLGLNRNPLWNDIKRAVDNDTLQRYKKYIYLYLEREFEKD